MSQIDQPPVELLTKETENVHHPPTDIVIETSETVELKTIEEEESTEKADETTFLPCTTNKRKRSPSPPEKDATLTIPTSSPVEILRRISEKEEKLRQLKLLDVYQKKHSISELTELVEKWKEVARSAAYDLLEKKKTGCEDLNMENLLKHMDIPPELIDIEVD